MKKILCLFLALVMVLSLVACGGKKEDPKPNDTPVVENNDNTNTQPDGNTPVENPTEGDENEDVSDNVIKTDKFTIPETDAEAEGDIEIAARTADKFALNYVAAIAQNFYTSALDAFQVNGTPFMSANDIKYSAPRGDLKNLVKHAGKEVFLEVNTDNTISNDGNATVCVDLKTDDKTLETFEVKLAMNADNVWYVVDDTYYIKDFYVVTSGNTELYVDDVLVPEDYFVEHVKVGNLQSLYKLPIIGRSAKVFKCVTENFEGTLENTPEPNTKDEPLFARYELEGEELKEALEAVKTLWNNMYNDWVADNNADLTKYFSKTSSPSYPADVKAGFKELRKASSYEDIDHHITIIEKRADADCVYGSDTVIILNIQYQLDWVWDFSLGGPEHCRRFSHILLTKEDDEWKIYEISDMKLFNEEYGNDW